VESLRPHKRNSRQEKIFCREYEVFRDPKKKTILHRWKKETGGCDRESGKNIRSLLIRYGRGRIISPGGQWTLANARSETKLLHTFHISEVKRSSGNQKKRGKTILWTYGKNANQSWTRTCHLNSTAASKMGRSKHKVLRARSLTKSQRAFQKGNVKRKMQNKEGSKKRPRKGNPYSLSENYWSKRGRTCVKWKEAHKKKSPT